MKKQLIIFLTVLAINNFSFAQDVSNRKGKVTDNVKFPRQKKFEDHIDLLEKNNYLSFGEKKVFKDDILDTPEKAKVFIVNLALLQYPQSKNYIEKYFQISEDKSKRIWFAVTRLGEPGKVTDGELSIIVRKNDCKVIQFSNFF